MPVTVVLEQLVLPQTDDGGDERVIAYASCASSKLKRNYCVTHYEFLVVVHFTYHFRQYLLGRHFNEN